MKMEFSTADLALARRMEEAEAANAFQIGRVAPGGPVHIEIKAKAGSPDRRIAAPPLIDFVVIHVRK